MPPDATAVLQARIAEIERDDSLQRPERLRERIEAMDRLDALLFDDVADAVRQQLTHPRLVVRQRGDRADSDRRGRPPQRPARDRNDQRGGIDANHRSPKRQQQSVTRQGAGLEGIVRGWAGTLFGVVDHRTQLTDR